MSPLLAVLAGGRSRRMGRDKAWLPAPGGGEALIERLLRLGCELELPAIVIGADAPPGIACLQDDPVGVGPIGGLHAVCVHAGEQPVLALACDLPYVDRALLARLAHTPSAAAVLAPRAPGTAKWQPLFARYQPTAVLPALRRALAAGEHSLQAVLRDLPVDELPLSADEHERLRDWDEPADMIR